jgi:hypothetical protein
MTTDGETASYVRRALRALSDAISVCPCCCAHHHVQPALRAAHAVLELLDRDDADSVVSTREVFEVLAEALDDDSAPSGPLRWGPWALNPAMLVLRCTLPDVADVPLQRCTDPALTLDQVLRVARAPWTDAATIAGLVRAVEDVLRPPGPEWVRTPRQIARLVAEFAHG